MKSDKEIWKDAFIEPELRKRFETKSGRTVTTITRVDDKKEKRVEKRLVDLEEKVERLIKIVRMLYNGRIGIKKIQRNFEDIEEPVTKHEIKDK